MNSNCNCQKKLRYHTSIPPPNAWDRTIEMRQEECGDPLILFHFVCRWTCSRCWKRALLLSRSLDSLHGQDIALVMVGPSKYIKAANRMAKEYHLPVTLLADDWHSLHRAYALSTKEEFRHGESLVLADKYGMVRYRDNAPGNGSIFCLVEHLKSVGCQIEKNQFELPTLLL